MCSLALNLRVCGILLFCEKKSTTFLAGGLVKLTNGLGFDEFIEGVGSLLLVAFLEVDMSGFVELMVRTEEVALGRSKARELAGTTGSTDTAGEEDEDTGLDWTTVDRAVLSEVDETLGVGKLTPIEALGSCRRSTFFENLNVLRSSSWLGFSACVFFNQLSSLRK